MKKKLHNLEKWLFTSPMAIVAICVPTSVLFTIIMIIASTCKPIEHTHVNIPDYTSQTTTLQPQVTTVTTTVPSVVTSHTTTTVSVTTTTSIPIVTEAVTTKTTTAKKVSTAQVYNAPSNFSERPVIPGCTLSDELQEYVYNMSVANNVEYELVMAVACCESTFNTDAYNGTCYGLMQIHRCNKGWIESELGITDLLNPYNNMYVGITILSDYRTRYNISDTLLCYNCGEGGASGKLGTSTNYTKKVLDKYNEYVNYTV